MLVCSSGDLISEGRGAGVRGMQLDSREMGQRPRRESATQLMRRRLEVGLPIPELQCRPHAPRRKRRRSSDPASGHPVFNRIRTLFRAIRSGQHAGEIVNHPTGRPGDRRQSQVLLTIGCPSPGFRGGAEKGEARRRPDSAQYGSRDTARPERIRSHATAMLVCPPPLPPRSRI